MSWAGDMLGSDCPSFCCGPPLPLRLSSTVLEKYRYEAVISSVFFLLPKMPASKKPPLSFLRFLDLLLYLFLYNKHLFYANGVDISMYCIREQ